MPNRIFVVVVLLLASSSASAAPRYMNRPRATARMIMRSQPGPAPAPAPQEAAPEPRLARIVAQPFRTAPAAPPPTQQPLRSIDAEALASFFPAFESGGGFMPLTLGGSGLQPRGDVVIQQ